MEKGSTPERDARESTSGSRLPHIASPTHMQARTHRDLLEQDGDEDDVDDNGIDDGEQLDDDDD